MYKLQIQWLKEGDWHPCVFPPTPYDIAHSRWKQYSQRNPEHNYKLVPTELYNV